MCITLEAMLCGLQSLPLQIFHFETDEGKEDIFSFPLPGLKDDEEVLEVEFHVYHSRLPREQRHLLDHNTYMVSYNYLSFTPDQYTCNVTFKQVNRLLKYLSATIT